MCRILAFRADDRIDAGHWLTSFAEACRDSREDQSHGWGVAWRDESGWRRYRSLEAVWETSFELPHTRLAIAHARSAFRDEGIELPNNMPFLRDELAFAFNGELRGVRLNAPGQTGAARLEHLLHRFTAAQENDVSAGLRRLDTVAHARSEYVRALNVVVSDGSALFAHCRYGEDPEYFALHHRVVGGADRIGVVSSDPIGLGDVGGRWQPMANGTTLRVGDDAGAGEEVGARGGVLCSS
jgi:glutamine amidotransferase